MGKLIVIEGTDASGKSTQFQLLKDKLDKKFTNFKTVVFPRYSKDSTALVRAYLNGDYGSKPSDVNAYAASTFFAVDRFASYKDDWGKHYEDGGIVLADRYTTSNAIHQASKLQDNKDFLNWLFDFEYNKLGLPKPDLTIFLDMPPTFAAKLLKDRQGKDFDIHELDGEYLRQCYQTSVDVCSDYDWCRIDCIENNNIKSIEQISNEIYNKVKEIL